MRVSRLVLSCFVVAVLSACGGNGGSSSPRPDPGTTPPPSPTPPPAAANPCEAALAALDAPLERAAARRPGKTGLRVDHHAPWRVLDSLWLHRAARQRGLLEPAAGGPSAIDVGEIAVLEDGGDLIIPANRFDLASLGLDFRPSGDGYVVTRAAGAFRPDLGTPLSLEDDDSSEVNLPFEFPFYGGVQGRAFVNSDGNVTFGAGDEASTERGVSRFLTGPPRVAPFFADLDPSAGDGRVFLQSASDGVTVTWCGVPGFDVPETVSAQMTLLPDGGVEFRYGATVTLPDAVVGISPGETGEFSPADLSRAAGTGSGPGAVGERFSDNPDIDLVAVARRFYESHGDDYDQLVIWTDTRVVSGDTFAYETTVSNEIRGLGIPTFDAASDFGSGGRLRSLVVMDDLTKYPADPGRRFLGENTTLSVLAHETGHRWLAFLRFRGSGGRQSDELLGRDQAHWSFFMDSDGSVMEGNDIEDLGGGSFRTIGAVERYSLLDQYAMGLIDAADVPPFFYVEAPTNVRPDRERDSAPDVGVTFSGTRREVRIEDVVDALGERQPSFRSSPRVHRQVFVYVLSNGRTLDEGQVNKLDRIRREWPDFFRGATNRRMRVEAELR